VTRARIEAVELPSDRRAQSAYSPAVRAGGFIFVSGLGPLDSEARVIGEEIEEQARVTLENMDQVLHAAGGSLSDLVSVRVYLASMDDYQGFNRVYEQFIREEPYPARICLQAGALWEGVLVEIEAVALASGSS
jgi:2-iminobutanoate/2-iminopropanoate deaminase